jgi:hypothetical protein
MELIITGILLFVTFGLLFPRFVYETKWEDAKLILTSRDVVITSDRVGLLYTHSFNPTIFQEFVKELFPVPEIRLWLSGSETIRSTLLIACNCTLTQIQQLEKWFDGLRVNGREINVDFCQTDLTTIDRCGEQEVEAAFIFGYSEDFKEDETLEALQTLIEYGKGVVEMLNFASAEQANLPVQQEIFRIQWGEIAPAGETNFARLPDNSLDLIYGPWKYFYHIPVPLSVTNGNFSFRDTTYSFWLVGDEVCFDTNENNECDVNDLQVKVEESFTLNDSLNIPYNFSLRYAKPQWIGISFDRTYKFDFSGAQVAPTAGETHRILLQDQAGAPTSILNVLTAWLKDLTLDGVKDDERLLLISLLLWVSDKGPLPVPFPTGYLTSYVDVINQDMFEVYRVDVGISKIL